MPTPTPTPTPTSTPVIDTAKYVLSSKPEYLDSILSCNDYIVKLFKNNLDENNISFVECDFDGYESKPLDKNNWNPSTVESGYVVSYYNQPLVWGCSDIVESDIYGYFIINDNDSVIWYYKFPEPVTVVSLQAISISIRIVLGCP